MQFRITEFRGLDQSRDEMAIPATHSPDACNVSTDNGRLSVAAGYAKYVAQSVPGGIGTLCAFYRRVNGAAQPVLLAVNEAGVYALTGGAWTPVYEGAGANEASFLNYQRDGADILLIADGVRPVLTWSGTGSMTALDGCSRLFSQLALHYERVWGSGIATDPDAVYWSRAYDPGDWTGDEDNPASGGGVVMIPTWNGGSVVAIRTLFDDVLVFKDDDLYRIVGTYPGDYEVVRVHGVSGPVAKNSIVATADACYFLSKDGLCAYDGMTVAPVGGDAAKGVTGRLNRAYMHKACGALYKNTVYMALPLDEAQANNAVLEIDMKRGAFLLREGLRADCFLPFDDRLLFASDDGYVYEYGRGDDYDGAAVSARWRVPWRDLGDPSGMKYLRALDMFAEGSLRVKMETDMETREYDLSPGDSVKHVRLRLGGKGRRFSMTFSNRDGSTFSVMPGATVTLEADA